MNANKTVTGETVIETKALKKYYDGKAVAERYEDPII